MLSILVIFPAMLLPICTRDLAMPVQYQSDVMFKTLWCSIHVHAFLVDQPLPMFVMLNSYSSVAQTTHHGGPIDGPLSLIRMVPSTSKYPSGDVLVSTLCVLLVKYIMLSHDRVCLFTAEKCTTLHEVSTV